MRAKKWEAFVIKTSEVHNLRGWGNGYVIIPKGSFLEDKSEEWINELLSRHLDFYVHGGCTLYERAKDWYESDRKNKWYGKFKKNDDRWFCGFDTRHLVDEKLRWNMKSVKEETKRFREALMKLDKLITPKDLST